MLDPEFEFEAPQFVDFERLDDNDDSDKWFGILFSIKYHKLKRNNKAG